ncbi:unnamed protein product [Bursaphelenchus okinawaensis]|uniref:Uncharacterized protein n=1 Tax=Bursaphelenchus okinawaensis TaxID=465554 RepID=A0A811LA18_9BILA|nr:unnamed protein product [Bursaphelenchus okinawaensis]CAG9121859.1 unnamed protein product [Bursaphelenchus okinawaensis]
MKQKFLRPTASLGGNSRRDDEALKFKAKLIESGIAQQFPPCNDFQSFATSNISSQYVKKRKAELMKDVMNNLKTNIGSLKKVKQLYDQCQQSPVVTKRRFVPGRDAKDAEFNTDYLRRGLKEENLEDNNDFYRIYRYVLAVLFQYGAPYLDPLVLGHTVYIGRPDGQTFGYEDTCVPQMGADKCDDMAEYVLNVTHVYKFPKFFYFPRNVQYRKQLLEQLLYIFENSQDYGKYDTCEDFITDVFPIYYRKMLNDYMEKSGHTLSDIDVDFLKMYTEVIEAFETTKKVLDLKEDQKDKIGETLEKKIKIMPFYHPVYDEDGFNNYFGNAGIDVNTLWSNRYILNMRKFLQYCYDHSKGVYTASLKKHVEMFEEEGIRYIGFGFEAIDILYYHKAYPPAINFASLAGVIDQPAINQIIYNAYQKQNRLFIRRNNLAGKKLDYLSGDQLYFVNLAQTFVLRDISYNMQKFSQPKSAAWDFFKCQRAFSNTFNCNKGMVYYKEDNCKIVKGLIQPNYDLSYYKIDKE